MRNQMWLRIIDDYQKSNFPRKQELLNLFENEVSGLDSLNFQSGVDQTEDSLLKLIEATRRMYEENGEDSRRGNLLSIHNQSITMLENVLLINDLKY